MTIVDEGYRPLEAMLRSLPIPRAAYRQISAELHRLRDRNAELEGLRDLCRELVDRYDHGIMQRTEVEIVDAMRDGIEATRTKGDA